MKESKTTKKLAEALSSTSIFNTCKSRNGAILLFNENYISSLYSERFNITDNLEKFERAFQIVTNSVGNEASKINSVISSSLLSLLIFHRLFENKSDEIKLNLNLNEKDYTFTQALFEVRNKVIGYPSCVDVVLKAKEDGTLLFLESKFTEYIDGLNRSETYGSSYCALYKHFKDFMGNAGLSVETSDHSLQLRSDDGEKYIEGIKQSISHLIGLVKGPQEVIDGPYDEAYLKEYKSLFKNAPRLIYGTILFDPSHVLKDAKASFDEYVDLYKKTIGANGDKIVTEIKRWCSPESKTVIEVLNSPITYQNLLFNNDSYKENLPKRIKQFYHLL